MATTSWGLNYLTLEIQIQILFLSSGYFKLLLFCFKEFPFIFVFQAPFVDIVSNRFAKSLLELIIPGIKDFQFVTDSSILFFGVP